MGVIVELDPDSVGNGNDELVVVVSVEVVVSFPNPPPG